MTKGRIVKVTSESGQEMTLEQWGFDNDGHPLWRQISPEESPEVDDYWAQWRVTTLEDLKRDTNMGRVPFYPLP